MARKRTGASPDDTAAAPPALPLMPPVLPLPSVLQEPVRHDLVDPAVPTGMVRISDGQLERCIWPVHLPGWEQQGWHLVAAGAAVLTTAPTQPLTDAVASAAAAAAVAPAPAPQPTAADPLDLLLEEPLP